MPSEHLYDISEKFLEFSKIAEESSLSGAVDPAMGDTLEAIEGEFEEKAKMVMLVAKESIKSVPAIDAEIKRLQARKKSLVSNEKWLKEYLRKNMIATGINKIECDLFTITLKKAVAGVEITDEDEIPDELCSVTTVLAPDKKEILKRLKAGDEVPGAALKEGTRSLLIR